jgi:16S rRNA (cytidine1402-2'-O)-methyltransferase
MNGILYIVPTPIGNLEDITLRAINVLKSVDLIACEDTRQTLKLLSHLGVSKQLISFYSYNQNARIPNIIKSLTIGKNVALVSDAGTPAVSDPGYLLVKEAIANNINVVPLPGATAITTALVASGLPTYNFIFLGFLKRKTGKMKKELQAAMKLNTTVIFYESPHRIIKTIETLAQVFGMTAQVCLAREMTKKFEEFIRGTADEVLANLKNRKEILGEFVVLVCQQDEAKTAKDEATGEQDD